MIILEQQELLTLAVAVAVAQELAAQVKMVALVAAE
jgi:hypothetical protein